MIYKFFFLLFSPLLFLLSLIFSLIVYFRNLSFDLNFKKKRHLKRPVISVGNISVGGSGKTALVLELLKHNTSLCVLTRGYKSEATQQKQNPILVPDFKNPRHYGDEPSLIKEKYPNTPVVLDPNRYRGGEFALAQNSEISGFILDDGFQHRSLHRDLNILLFDMDIHFRYPGRLPFGRFRESLAAIKRADFVLITKWMGYSDVQVEHLKLKLQSLCSNVECLKTKITKIQNINHENLLNRDVMLFSGLGQPEIFEADVRRGFPQLKIVEHKKYPDHHSYSVDDLKALLDLAEKNRSTLVCSEKDLIKVKQLGLSVTAFYATSQELELSQNLKSIVENLLKKN